MNKTIITLMSFALLIIVFSGCNIFPQDTDEFDFLDTVSIAIGEKLYANENLWVRLDSITEDSRCPVGMYCLVAGGVEAWFTVWVPDTLYSIKLRTDSVRSHIFVWSAQASTYWLTILNVEPDRYPDQTIKEKDYRVNFVLEEGVMAFKPNIYLYPKRKTKLSVSLDFPYGGEVTVSDPLYPTLWQDISVTSSGLINKEHEFLFYEAKLPNLWQYENGWVVQQEYLEEFFRDNMIKYGFHGKEIDDFIEYWIPRLNETPFYAIYPQHTDRINEAVPLSISKKPRSMLRLFYVIEPTDQYFKLPKPTIYDFQRKGFSLTEWGVIL